MRSRLLSPAAAAGCAFVLVAAAALPVAIAAHDVTFGSVAGLTLLMSPFAAVGVLVASRQPRNPIGWLLVALAVCMVLSGVAGEYAVIAFRQGHPGLPLARLAVALTQTWIGLVILLPLPIVLFPDGRLPSRRWRFTLWVYLAAAAVLVVDVAVRDAAAFTERHVRVDSSGELATFGGSGGWANLLAIPYAAIVISWVFAKVVDYRRSTGERRQQLKWLGLGGGVAFAALVVSLQGNGSVAFLGIAALPLGIGVGILKYRLYEVDRLISRTISYAIVTGTLVGLFVGLVSLTTGVLPFSSPVGVAASTLAAAALFNPLRVRVQRVIDRRFNRARYDAEATVAAFALRLRNAVDIESVQAGLRETVNGAVAPAHVSVWLRGTS